ncbi:MAG: RHS repeat domain-containing protein [Cyanobacteria bacterium J06638_28]
MDWTQLIYPDAIPTYLTDNPAVTTEYTRDSRVQASIDERGNRTAYRYDALGRLTETIYADDTPNDLSDNPRMTVTYDAAGRRTAETDALGYTTRYIYDDLGRVTETIFQDGPRTQVDDDDADCCDYCGRSITLPRRRGNESDRPIGNDGTRRFIRWNAPCTYWAALAKSAQSPFGRGSGNRATTIELAAPSTLSWFWRLLSISRNALFTLFIKATFPRIELNRCRHHQD